jgi:Holliday junction resolvase RusA-like endonuclease
MKFFCREKFLLFGNIRHQLKKSFYLCGIILSCVFDVKRYKHERQTEYLAQTMKIINLIKKKLRFRVSPKSEPIMGMKNCVLKRQPKSYNSWNKTSQIKKDKYKSDIENAFKKFYPTPTKLAEDLYGIVYYFHRNKNRTDADNISKPIWDCLNGFLYDDDIQIKLRTAGIIDISNGDLEVFDFTNISGEMTLELIEAFETTNNFAYIECGLLHKFMYKFNLEYHGN